MPPETRRRSSRTPKQLAIFLIGSDIEGRIFSEETKTVVLSRHGAGILSQYKLSAEQEIIIRGVDSGKEVEVRVVGQIGIVGDNYIYGVAFLDPELNFWGLEFTELTEAERQANRVLLECSSCKAREMVDHSDLESDVFAMNQSVVRYCKRCGSSTVWREPSGDLAPAPALARPVAEADSPYAGPFSAAPPPPRFAPSAETPAEQPSSQSATPAPSASKTATPAAPQAPARPEDRRRHTRTKVKYQACIRRPGMPDEVVSCEDMSRGGLRFKSKKQFYASTMIEVAVPYSPGGQSIFVPGQIVYVHESPGEDVFHCGVAYRRSSR
jgi:hypothetical protein